jgi:hypothetical protein
MVVTPTDVWFWGESGHHKKALRCPKRTWRETFNLHSIGLVGNPQGGDMQRRGASEPGKRRRTTGRKARKTPTTAHVQQQVDALTRELQEEREQRKATSESQVGRGSTFAFTLPVVVERQMESA